MALRATHPVHAFSVVEADHGVSLGFVQTSGQIITQHDQTRRRAVGLYFEAPTVIC